MAVRLRPRMPLSGLRGLNPSPQGHPEHPLRMPRAPAVRQADVDGLGVEDVAWNSR